MLEQIQAMLGAINPPTHAHVGEAFTLHQNLSAYYFLLAKCALYEHHAQAPELKGWYRDARTATAARITQLEAEMDRLGVPKPPTLPITMELTDQFMGLDGLAMVRGMLMADLIGIQTGQHSTLITLYRSMLDSTLLFGTRLVGVAEKEGWLMQPPAYEASPTPPH